MGSDATDRVRHALLVEDEALVAMVAEEFLAELGFEPISARNAAEAMEIVESRRDLVVAVVDVGLPDQRGDDLARRLRTLRPELPILMASGYDQGDDEVLAGRDDLHRLRRIARGDRLEAELGEELLGDHGDEGLVLHQERAADATLTARGHPR